MQAGYGGKSFPFNRVISDIPSGKSQHHHWHPYVKDSRKKTSRFSLRV
jgi:hypothetical protein